MVEHRKQEGRQVRPPSRSSGLACAQRRRDFVVDSRHSAHVKITSIWPDGVLISASSWNELEDKLRAQQWQDYEVDEFRADMRRRMGVLAELEGREPPDISVTDSEQLFRDLESCGQIRLEVEL